MNAARRFGYSFDVLSIGRCPVISFYVLSELSQTSSNFDILSETGGAATVFEINGEVCTFHQQRPGVMNAARRFEYSFDVLSVGRSPVITFYVLSELSHSAGTFDILSETGSPARIFEINGEVSHSISRGRVL